MGGGKALLLTVGTGTADQLEQTLLTPLRKSIEKGQWAKVVLLPSKQTEANAFAMREANPSYPIEVRALRRPGDEEDVDACFEHCERQVAALVEGGFAAGEITADFTRGTKAMSAGLVLAAIVHGIPALRYITSSQRDNRGMVVPGSENPSDFATAKITVRRELERALNLIRAGQFAAAERICAIAPAGPLAGDVRWAKWCAQFWGCWDRFEYAAAQKLAAADGLPRRPGWVGEFRPSEKHLKSLGGLAAKLPASIRERVSPCRILAADILANARRRLAEGQTEEVLVRCYRVTELIGQYRLLAWGYDSGDLRPPEEWAGKLAEQGAPLRRDRDGRIQIGRELTAQLLEHLGDPVAGQLLNPDWPGGISPAARNKSILIHGFWSRTRGRRGQVETLLGRVERFYAEEHSENAARLEGVQFPFLSC
jgi:CRISPR-associated protein (TIGR02710 family)